MKQLPPVSKCVCPCHVLVNIQHFDYSKPCCDHANKVISGRQLTHMPSCFICGDLYPWCANNGKLMREDQ